VGGFGSVKDLVESIDTGKSIISSFRKIPSQPSTNGTFSDLSMAAGNPVTNYYASAPLVAAKLKGREGIFPGPDMMPDSKFIKSILCSAQSGNVAPCTLLLCDYLLYYPFLDGDSTDYQLLDNTVTLPRYQDGLGVKAFVVAQGSYVGGARFKMTYTNELGVSNRESRWITSNNTAQTASIISSGVNANAGFPFIPLQEGDKGIRSVQSFQFENANGGIFALVLCAPIATTTIREINAPVEKDFFKDTGMASRRVFDGAYLNFLILPVGNIQSSVIMGIVEIAWS
jgi:hypothetical protein